jgi:CHAT domain-containing protein
VSAIEQSLTRSSAFKAKVLDVPSKGKVLEELKVSRVVHFVCHGVSVAEDPSSSYLLLRNGPDGNPQQLTVRELAKISFQQAQLAYLSACSTAETSSRDLMDEVIHVASDFQFAGFPDVIGTYGSFDWF